MARWYGIALHLPRRSCKAGATMHISRPAPGALSMKQQLQRGNLFSIMKRHYREVARKAY
jgi:hypothetical protein